MFAREIVDKMNPADPNIERATDAGRGAIKAYLVIIKPFHDQINISL